MRNSLKAVIASVFLITGCALIGYGHSNRHMKIPATVSEYAKVSVMITNEDMNSGGTGVIIDSHPGYSRILTNKHVCELIQVGGKVISDNGTEYPINGFQVYKKHDLCLINVLKDLNVQVKIAKQAPEVYSPSIVVGHPALLPSIITVGHFSQIRMVQIAVGYQPCDGSETGATGLSCIFNGGKPLIVQYQAQVTSSTIMPGSSGSGVFNEHGELAGLIFAGSPGLSYGMLVPWEYVNDFLSHLKKYPVQTPDPNKEPKSFFTSNLKNIEEICQYRNTDGTCKDRYVACE